LREFVLKLAIVGPTHPFKGGVSQHTTMLAHRATSAGHDVDLISWTHQYPDRLYPGVQRLPMDRPETPPFPRTTYPLSWRRPDGWLGTGKRLRRHDVIALVLVTPLQIPAYLTIISALRRRGGCPRLVVLAHNVLPHEQRLGDRFLVRRLFQRVDGVVVHTHGQKELAVGLDASCVEVVSLPPLLPAASGARRGGRRNSLLFFGFIRHYKGLDVLLRALPNVPDVKLVVAGELWGDDNWLRDLLGAPGVQHRVVLELGYVDMARVDELFAGADALVLPYRSGTASSNATLAKLHGIPVVGSWIEAIQAEVEEGVDGLLVPPDDPEALANALCALYRPGCLEQLSAGVQKPDIDGPWRTYVRTLERIGED